MPLQIQILDIDRGVPVFETQILFDDIEKYHDEDFWLQMRDNDPSSPKLRLRLKYLQNEVLKWDGKVREVSDDIRDFGSTLSQVRAFIDQLRTPFGFLSRQVEAKEKELRQADREAIEAEKQPDHKYYDKEMQAVAAFDKTLGGLANKYGYDVETIPWLNVTKAAVWILLILVLL